MGPYKKSKISASQLAALARSGRKAMSKIQGYARKEFTGKTPAKPFQAGRFETPKGKRRTPGGTFVKLNRVGAQSSTSGGRLKTSKYKITKRQKNSMKGVEQTYERASEISTTQQVAWVGHVSAAANDVLVLMWRAIIKQLFAKANVNIRNLFDDVKLAPYSLTQGDQVTVCFDTSDGVQTLVNSIVPGTAWIFDQFVTIFYSNASLRAPDVKLKYIMFKPSENALGAFSDPPTTRLDLDHMYIKLYTKSSMKIQNRSVNASGANSENVDNVPVYGRSYGGTGTGAVQLAGINTAVATQLIGDSTTGFIAGSSADPGLQEPIHQMYFQYVSQKGKVHMDPGYIKTSVLYHKQNYSLNRLNQMISQITTNTKQRNVFGKFRFFGIERMLDTALLASPATITLGIEINTYMNASLYSRFRNATVPIFVRNNI